MNVRALVVGGFVAGAVVALAPSARADGFFVTFTGANGLGGRIAGASFQTSTTMATDPGAANSATGSTTAAPVALELDEWSNVEALFDMQSRNQILGAKVEFTTPNAAGQEEVYMTATYTNVVIVEVTATFDTTATDSKVKQAVSFVFQNVQYASVPPPGSTVARLLPKTVPRLTRATTALHPLSPTTLAPKTAMATAPAPTKVDDAYFKAAGFPGESSDHPGESKLVSVTIHTVSPRDSVTGQPSGTHIIKPVVITKAPGTASPKFQNALSQHNVFDATITFVQHNGTAPDGTSHTLQLNGASVVGDSMQVGGTSRESITFGGTKRSMTNAATSSTWTQN